MSTAVLATMLLLSFPFGRHLLLPHGLVCHTPPRPTVATPLLSPCAHAISPQAIAAALLLLVGLYSLLPLANCHTTSLSASIASLRHASASSALCALATLLLLLLRASSERSSPHLALPTLPPASADYQLPPHAWLPCPSSLSSCCTALSSHCTQRSYPQSLLACCLPPFRPHPRFLKLLSSLPELSASLFHLRHLATLSLLPRFRLLLLLSPLFFFFFLRSRLPTSPHPFSSSLCPAPYLYLKPTPYSPEIPLPVPHPLTLPRPSP